jgi:hypothetical protein
MSVVERSEARFEALDTCLRSAAILTRSRRLLEESVKTCRASLQCLMACRPQSRYALIQGEVDREPVQAVVRLNGAVLADPPLLERAQLLVALGDTFDHGRIAASVSDGPTAAALTLIRACNRVHAIEMQVPRPSQKRRLE